MGTQPDKQQGRRRTVAAVAAGLATTLTALTVGAAPVFAKPGGDAETPSTTSPAPAPPKQDSSASTGAGRGADRGTDYGAEQPAPKRRSHTPDAEVPGSPVVAVPPVAPAAPEVPAVRNTPSALAQSSPTQSSPAQSSPPVPVVAAPPSHVEAAPPTVKAMPPESPEPSAPVRPSAETAVSTSVTKSPTSTVVAERPSVLPAPDFGTPDRTTDRSAAQGNSLTDTKLGESTVAGPATTVAATSTSADRPAPVVRQVRQAQTLRPETLTAPVADVAVAKAAAAVEVKPVPAPVQEVQDLAKVVDVARFEHDTRADWDRGGDHPESDRRDNRNADRHDDRPVGRDWDNRVRQWQPDWVQYDEYYRPVLFNPYRDPVRIVYVYRNAPRIVYIPPLQRIAMEVADLAAYSFTAVVVNAVNTAVNVAVGSFFGGGYYPGVGIPLPPPPPPVLRYDNVPVQVRYSDATYQPFRVQRIVDVGADTRYGEHKILLDGVTPAWGVWTQNSSGERQFEIHKTQQFPGLDDPREAPLPGDYQLRLVSDQQGLDDKTNYLIIAAGTCAVLSLGAFGLSVYIGRRRRES